MQLSYICDILSWLSMYQTAKSQQSHRLVWVRKDLYRSSNPASILWEIPLTNIEAVYVWYFPSYLLPLVSITSH